MASPAGRRIEVQDYLDAERNSGTKHEFLDGVMYDMAGASFAHVRIASNLLAECSTRLRGSPCTALGSDLRVQVEGGIFYPDLTLVCGQPVLSDERQDVLLNPTCVFEVLSPSTERFDRGRKIARYQMMSSIHLCILVAQDEPVIEVFSRQQEGWLLTRYAGAEAVADLPAVGLVLPLAAVYEGVTFGENTMSPLD